MKIKSYFLLIYGIGGVIFLSIITVLVFFSMQKSMTEQLETQFLSNSEAKLNKLHESLNDIAFDFQFSTKIPMFRLFRYHQLTLNEPAMLDDIRQLEIYFLEQQKSNKSIIKTQLINENGLELLHIENQTINNNIRNLYQDSNIQTALKLSDGEIRITIEPETGNPDTITWWLPVYVSNNIHLGIIAIHINFDYISSLINKISEPNYEWICLYSDNNILLSATDPIQKCTTSTNDLWSHSKIINLSNINWSLTIQTKQKTYLNDVITLRWITFGFILPLIAAIALLTILVTSRNITSSIKNIVLSARSLGSDKRYLPANASRTDELNQLSKELNRTAQLIQKRTNELIQSNNEIESFSYTIAHDLRTPLRTIAGFSEILLKQKNDKLDTETTEYLIRINSAAHTMSDLIDKILELSRITRLDSHLEKTDLSQLAEKILHDLSISDPDRKIQWNIEQNMTVQGDRQLLKTLLENILGNAWKYTKNKENARINFYSIIQDNETVYCVQDNGAGFNMKYIDKLFKPFERLHSKNDFEGTGVGLASAERIISKHHGRIWAESQLNQGTSFYFIIPDKL